ncbi:GNAT family N-acetyltransferase [Catenuloplanes japonicus]|uniref:GNAT family N-acetyltransferase n=1 Tax=Catenuloplanes japonicus TaxID=33876 RepID=UPI0005243813|nr:GNAT family protein [Catenuloplanes japonicus]
MHGPLPRLTVTTPRLTLRLPSENELVTLGDVAAAGVHPPGERPFLTPWTDLAPPARAQHVIAQHRQRLDAWRPEDWALETAAFHQGTPIGLVTLKARDFTTTRHVRTESWLGLAYHRQGFGTEARAALLHLAFHGLHAEDAFTDVFQDNAGSQGVSRRLGYRHDGTTEGLLHGETVISDRLRLDAADWATVPHPPAQIAGLAPCLPLFGATGGRRVTASS